jgi:hypothetical protein
LSQITKAFVTLGFVIGIDDMFASTLPEGARENMERLNLSKTLVLKKDYNTFGKIFFRIRMRFLYKFCCHSKKVSKWWTKSGVHNPGFFYEVANLSINIIYFITVNFKSIIFSYYTGIICIAF